MRNRAFTQLFAALLGALVLGAPSLAFARRWGGRASFALRGHANPRKVLYCPAFPFLGRVTVRTRLLPPFLYCVAAAAILMLAVAGEATAQTASPGQGGGAGTGPGTGNSGGGAEWHRDHLRERGWGIFSGLFRPQVEVEEEEIPETRAPAPRRVAKPKPPRRPVRTAVTRPSGIYQGSDIPIPTIRPPFAGPAIPIPDAEFMPDEVLATVEGDAAEAAAIANAFNLEIITQRSSGLLGAYFVRYRIPDGRAVQTVAAALAADPRVVTGEPNHVYVLQQAKVVNYAFQRISLESDAASGQGIDIAVIDSAVDETHDALAGALAEMFDAMPSYPVQTRDHGTSISGLIAGRGPFLGVAPGARIHHARAFEGGRSSTDILLAALDWAAERRVRIVNMSFVGPDNTLLERACEAARAGGMVLVAAAGNNGPEAPPGYPAAYDSVIAVTATDDDNRVMAQANRGAYVYVSAPGVGILAPIPGGIDAVTGTSFAAAVASGAIANLIEGGQDGSPEGVEKLLADTSVDLGDPGRDNDFGYGLINARAALGGR